MNIFSSAPAFLALATILLGAGLGPALAQSRAGSNDEQTYDTHKNLTVAVTRFAPARAALTDFIRHRSARVQKQEETPDQLIAEFALPIRELPRLDSLTAALGYVLENNLNAHDLTSRLQELQADEQNEASQLATLKKEQAEGRPNAEQRLAWGKLTEEHTERLTRVRHQLEGIAAHAGQAYVTLRLYDEVSFPTGNRRISFVNMPGVEYGYLHLDNPKVGLTSANYQGYSLKYLVTRGKSYLNLGVYKPVGATESNEEFVNELFVVNFGQDFYPRNFGRGRRRYLNLYTSYQLGGFILTRNNDRHNEFIPNLNLGLGVELLKTRHVLIDTKGSYFVPLNSRSRDLRGLLGQASFNFVF
ncbi:hypothetical protein GCM10022409_17970 [Hymenobacter glaciei]|uniref:Outer membrane protein beta-barrel domain-containing protein n=1 Tax=Hymenobacter glaciei TaxID=877209 RepID=A0ABP7U170_9BACT